MAQKKTRRDGTRTYEIPKPDGKGMEVYPSVTTILRVVDKPGIAYWAAREVARHAVDNLEVLAPMAASDPDGAVDWLKGAPWRQRDTKADTGTSVHAVIERFLRGETIPPEEQTPYFKAAVRFITDYQLEPVMNEAVVYSHRDKYAGTLDAIFRYKNDHFVCDWKTRQGKKASETSAYETELMQIAAYAWAEGILHSTGATEKMPLVGGASVVMLCEDGDYVVGRANLNEDYEAFMDARRLFEWKQGLEER